MELFTQEDKTKFQEALKALKSGAFKFNYDYLSLIDKHLEEIQSEQRTKYPLLQKDYYYIVAHTSQAIARITVAHKVLMRKYPEAQKTFIAIDKLLRIFITGHPIEDYKKFKKYMQIDIDALKKRLDFELDDIDDITNSLIQRHTVKANIAIAREMDIYTRIIELSKPTFNLLRVALEIYRGNKSPSKIKYLSDNIEILRTDSEFVDIFNCLDLQLRHASAHASRRIEGQTLYLLDTRGGQDIIVGQYTFEEFSNIINRTRNELFPILLPTIILFDLCLFLLLLHSTEYRNSIQN